MPIGRLARRNLVAVAMALTRSAVLAPGAAESKLAESSTGELALDPLSFHDLP